MGTNLKAYLLIFLLFLECPLYFGQKIQAADTLDTWISSFHMVSNLMVSKDNRFVAINKSYKNNNDTLLVFDARKPSSPRTTLVKLNAQKTFFSDGYLLASEAGRAEFIDLKNNKKEIYENVKRADGLEEINQYVILDQNQNLSIYGKDGNKLQTISGVHNYITDKRSKLYLEIKEGLQHQIMTWSNNKFISQFTTDREIARMEFIPSGGYLLITEKQKAEIQHTAGTDINLDLNSYRLKATFINTTNGRILYPKDIPFVDADLITVTSINHGKTYLIDFDNRIKPSKNKMLDIWYGNDKNLRFKKSGMQKHQYWLWKPDTNSTTKLPEEQFTCYAPINNNRYLLGFNVTEELNYISSTPLYKMHLYDAQTNSSKLIFSNTFQIIASRDGKYILSFDEINNVWVMYDIEASTLTHIRKGLQTPAFSIDGTSIFFGGESDLWRMDLKTKKINPFDIARGKQIKIINIKTEITYRLRNSSFEINTVDSQKPLILKVRDKTNNRSAYISWKKGKVEILIPPTENRIKEVKYGTDTKKVFSIEENYNKPPMLLVYNSDDGSTKELYSSGLADKAVSLLYQNIISYTNSKATPLNGVLYYPVHFDPAKKYPMVVRVYQKQTESSAVYPMPDFDEDGFNIRTLIERGYFVFLPDIIFDNRGTGISALDCVNSGLDAITSNPNINKEKIGLTGHSLGGYETNFIATHSDRFAAYVSGASVSDIVKFYFSYNTHFNIADYSRFETGQFEMGATFVEDKEKYIKNNPIYYVEKVNAPVLLWAGLKDGNVPPDQTMEFYIGLMKNSKLVTALLYHNKEHDLGKGTEESKDLNIRTLEWWDYHLKSKMNASWINQ
jgi:dipeptidyl aminopeptidase/acylaminoacyl peptidase